RLAGPSVNNASPTTGARKNRIHVLLDKVVAAPGHAQSLLTIRQGIESYCNRRKRAFAAAGLRTLAPSMKKRKTSQRLHHRLSYSAFLSSWSSENPVSCSSELDLILAWVKEPESGKEAMYPASL